MQKERRNDPDGAGYAFAVWDAVPPEESGGIKVKRLEVEENGTNFVIMPIETLIQMPADMILEMIERGKEKLQISVGQRIFAVSDYTIEMPRLNDPISLYGLAGTGKIKARKGYMEVMLYELRQSEEHEQMHEMTIKLL